MKGGTDSYCIGCTFDAIFVTVFLVKKIVSIDLTADAKNLKNKGDWIRGNMEYLGNRRQGHLGDKSSTIDAESTV